MDRTKGKTGFCGLAADIVMDCAMPHHGEEPPISGTRGAGTIFLSSCNLKCLYCQNHQISHRIVGKYVQPGQMSDMMLSLQEQGCHNIELVTPTSQMPRIVEAIVEAQVRGLTIPLVYNCGGYEDPDVIRLLENTVDVYLPDFKYGRADIAATLSGAEITCIMPYHPFKKWSDKLGMGSKWPMASPKEVSSSAILSFRT